MALTNAKAIESLESLERCYEHQKPFNQTDVDNLVKAVHASLTIRDYVMGELPNLKDTQTAVDFISALLPLIDEGERAPFYTILSSYYYELNDKELAFLSIVQAQMLDPNYSLAQLFTRVYKAGWESSQMTKMRGELHPKVSAEVFGEPDLVLA